MILQNSGIESRSGVAGGDASIVNTRIPVWGLVRYRQLGATDDDLLQWYPSLTRESLGNAWAYYEAHTEEIEILIEENEAA